MMISRLQLKNWRNFQDVEVYLREQTYLIGPNASGKSNLLDVFRFLRDVSKADGGGLQKAVKDRDGIKKLRCLHARRDPEVKIEIDIVEQIGSTTPSWRYILGFKPEGKGAQRLLVSSEEVWRAGRQLIKRPTPEDIADPTLLTQTYLEQLQANAKFREIAEIFNNTTYLHLVPQLLKYADVIGGNRLEDDPYGQGFLERVARTSDAARGARLKKISTALRKAVPQFSELKFAPDKVTGRPHLEALYEHHRPNARWQREEHFSDGTLRLLGLLWSLLDGDSLLLLEEPELSLNNAIVEQIPLLIQQVQRTAKRRRQMIISTHSEALLSNPGIDARGVIRLQPSNEGTRVIKASEEERLSLKAGLSIAEVLLPKTRPAGVQKLGLWE